MVITTAQRSMAICGGFNAQSHLTPFFPTSLWVHLTPPLVDSKRINSCSFVLRKINQSEGGSPIVVVTMNNKDIIEEESN